MFWKRTATLFLNSSWVLFSLLVLIVMGSVVFMGIEGTNEDLENLQSLVEQDHFNETHLYRYSPGEYEQEYTQVLRAAQLRCSLANLDLVTWNNMSYVEAMKFSQSIMTTIGWGVQYPRSQLSRLICMLYAIIGLPIYACLIAQGMGILTALENFLTSSPILMKIMKSKARAHFLVGLVMAVIILLPGPLIISRHSEVDKRSWLGERLTATGREHDFTSLTTLYTAVTDVATIGFGDVYIP